MCAVLKASKAGYYAWRNRKASERDKRDTEIAEKIVEIHRKSRKTYGSLETPA
jgi:hypothetical protein